MRKIRTSLKKNSIYKVVPTAPFVVPPSGGMNEFLGGSHLPDATFGQRAIQSQENPKRQRGKNAVWQFPSLTGLLI
jgi:hypothetical protein